MYNGRNMLGWGIIIYQASEPETNNSEDCIATWETGLGGDTWIRENCKAVGDNSGYPSKYETNGKYIKKMLQNGAVKNNSGTTVIHEKEGIVEGEDEGWVGKVRIDFDRLIKLNDDEVINIDTWDLS